MSDEASSGQLFYSHIDPVWSLLIIGTGCTLGRAPCIDSARFFMSGVGLPDIHDYSSS